MSMSIAPTKWFLLLSLLLITAVSGCQRAREITSTTIYLNGVIESLGVMTEIMTKPQSMAGENAPTSLSRLKSAADRILLLDEDDVYPEAARFGGIAYAYLASVHDFHAEVHRQRAYGVRDQTKIRDLSQHSAVRAAAFMAAASETRDSLFRNHAYSHRALDQLASTVPASPHGLSAPRPAQSPRVTVVLDTTVHIRSAVGYHTYSFVPAGDGVVTVDVNVLAGDGVMVDLVPSEALAVDPIAVLLTGQHSILRGKDIIRQTLRTQVKRGSEYALVVRPPLMTEGGSRVDLKVTLEQ